MAKKQTDKPPFQRPTAEEYKNADRQSVERRHQRLPSAGGRVAAIDTLHAELSKHADLYRYGSRQDQRDAVSGTILSLARYLKAQGFAEVSYEPMMRPLKALTERELNILDPLFTERKSANAPSRSLDKLERSGAIAAVANAWLKLRRAEEGKQNDKLAALARRIAGNWFGELTVAQIKSARELVSQEANEHPAVKWANMYSAHIETAMKLFGGEAGIEVVAHYLNRDRFRPE